MHRRLLDCEKRVLILGRAARADVGGPLAAIGEEMEGGSVRGERLGRRGKQHTGSRRCDSPGAVDVALSERVWHQLWVDAASYAKCHFVFLVVILAQLELH